MSQASPSSKRKITRQLRLAHTAQKPKSPHSPKALELALHRMQSKAGRVHVLRSCGGIETRENTLHLVHEGGADLAAVAALKKPLQSAMSEIPDYQFIAM